MEDVHMDSYRPGGERAAGGAVNETNERPERMERNPHEGDHYIANYAKTPYNPAPRFGRARSPGKQEEESNALLSKGLVVMNESTGKFEMEGETTLEPMKILGNTREPVLLFMGENPVTFKAWLDYQDPLIDEEVAARCYGQYKERYEYSQLLRFFQENCTQGWFKDLYDPEVASVIQGQLKERVANNLSKFIAALEDGKYDSFALEDPQEDSNRAEKVEKVESDGQADLEDGEEVELSEEDRVRANVEKAGIYLPPTNPYLLLKNVIQSISFPELSAVFADEPMLSYIATSDPVPMKRCSRVAWVVFKPEAILQDLYEKYKDAKVGETNLAVAEPSTLMVSFKARNTPDLAHLDQRLRHDLSEAKQLISHFEAVHDISTGILPRLCLDDAPEDLVIKSLDLAIITLRRVFLYCYYCGVKASCDEDMNRKCGVIHWRRAKDPAKKINEAAPYAMNWARIMETKTKAVLNGANKRILRHFNHATVEELYSKGVRTYLRQEDASKYRCIFENCNKLFKGEEYVVKHIRSKHAGSYPVPSYKTLCWSGYLSDPNRISYATMSTMRSFQTPFNNSRRNSTSWNFNDNNSVGGRDRNRGRITDRLDRGDRFMRDDRRMGSDPYQRPQPRKDRPEIDSSRKENRGQVEASYVDLDSPNAPKDDPFGTLSFDLSYE